ncbi:MAG: rhomboid family intrarane serine protease [Marmoricola sp.]|nr:rhomboid family intrarane serine protease [Marmoricola sp.]
MSTPPVGGPGGTESVPSAPPTCYRHPDRETWIRCQRCERPICPDCMTSASVGFQCPHCVKEGNKGTRQSRTPYGGQRVGDPRITTFVLIGINVAVWLLVQATGGRTSTLLDKLMLLPASAVYRTQDGSIVEVKGVSDGAWWQVLTSVFAHEQALHIGFNMLALYFLGPMLEQVLGRARFLALYLVSGLAGSAAVMLFAASNSQSLGASGAIFGLMGALAVIALKVRGQVQSILMWIGLNLVFTFTVGGISWQAHIGGLVAGAAVGAAMVYAPRGKSRAPVQWAATGAVLVVSLVLIAVRAVAL